MKKKDTKTRKTPELRSPDTRDNWPHFNEQMKRGFTLTEKICHRIENLEDRARESEVWRQKYQELDHKRDVRIDSISSGLNIAGDNIQRLKALGIERETTRGTALPPKFWQPICDHRDANEWAENIEELIEKLITSVGVHYQDTPDHVRRAALELAAAWDAETEEDSEDE